MRMIYAKSPYSCCSLTDMMAPVAKMQLTGEKLLIAVPVTSAAASLRASCPSTAITISSMFQHMLEMDDKSFDKAGGIIMHMVPGDFVWLPERLLVIEYALGQTDVQSTWLSWLAMTEWHMGDTALKNVLADVDFCIQRCSEPSLKYLEGQLKAKPMSNNKVFNSIQLFNGSIVQQSTTTLLCAIPFPLIHTLLLSL